MEQEWEEMTMMMEVPCGASIGNRKSGESFQILGLSSERPLVKINNQLYAGQLTDTIGTHMFLETEKTDNAGKEVVKDVIITDKCLKLEPVYLETKKDLAVSSKISSSENERREKEET